MHCIRANAHHAPCAAPAERVLHPNRTAGYSDRCSTGCRWTGNVPDVLRAMQERGVRQDEAARRLGGQP